MAYRERMGAESLMINDAGETVLPSSEEHWRQWVSASTTRNFMIGDPLTDWLNLHGENAGFTRDGELADYDERIDFGRFIMAKGIAFEAAVVEHLKSLHPVVTLSDGPTEVQDLDKAQDTYEALCAGQPIVHQGVLRDPESRTYGAPDFLIRSDILAKLFPGSISPEEASLPASGLGETSWHYVVVDAKFSTLSLAASGDVGNERSKFPYKAQVFIYNRALGRLQGYLPERSFLLGRSWEQGSGARKQRGRSAMERLGPVPNRQELGGQPLSIWVEEAAAWVRRVRSEGARWEALPEPSVAELWPTGSRDAPWKAAKTRIANELADLTLLWQVSARKRDEAHRNGLYSWRDPKCTAQALGVTGDAQGPTLQAILDINQSDGGPAVIGLLVILPITVLYILSLFVLPSSQAWGAVISHVSTEPISTAIAQETQRFVDSYDYSFATLLAALGGPFLVFWGGGLYLMAVAGVPQLHQILNRGSKEAARLAGSLFAALGVIGLTELVARVLGRAIPTQNSVIAAIAVGGVVMLLLRYKDSITGRLPWLCLGCEHANTDLDARFCGKCGSRRDG